MEEFESYNYQLHCHLQYHNFSDAGMETLHPAEIEQIYYWSLSLKLVLLYLIHFPLFYFLWCGSPKHSIHLLLFWCTCVFPEATSGVGMVIFQNRLLLVLHYSTPRWWTGATPVHPTPRERRGVCTSCPPKTCRTPVLCKIKPKCCSPSSREPLLRRATIKKGNMRAVLAVTGQLLLLGMERKIIWCLLTRCSCPHTQEWRWFFLSVSFFNIHFFLILCDANALNERAWVPEKKSNSTKAISRLNRNSAESRNC